MSTIDSLLTEWSTEAVRATLAVVKEGDRWRMAGIHLSFIAGTPGAPPIPGAPAPTSSGRT